MTVPRFTYRPEDIPPGVAAHVGDGVYLLRCAEEGCGVLYPYRFLKDQQDHLYEVHGKSVPLFARPSSKESL